MRGRYPFLFSYLVYSLLAMDLALFVIRHAIPGIYPVLYWLLEMLSVCLRFCVIWEIYRHTFPRGSLGGGLAPKGLSAPFFWTIFLFLGALNWIGAYGSFHSHFLALECSLSFAQALLVLSLLLFAKHFGFHMGRDIWGLAVGLGAYLSINILGFALFEIDRSMFQLYLTVTALSFAGMLAMWTWALWSYAPNPHPVGELVSEPAEETVWWERRWEKALGAVRKVVNP